jgi:hypothetical protein
MKTRAAVARVEAKRDGRTLHALFSFKPSALGCTAILLHFLLVVDLGVFQLQVRMSFSGLHSV